MWDRDFSCRSLAEFEAFEGDFLAFLPGVALVF